MIGTTLGAYRLEKELGSGGMGAVWLATATEDAAGVKAGEKVAVKIVHPHLLERSGFFKRFLREAEIGRSVRHESVVRTFDVDALAVDGRQINFMVMEYVEGKTLRALLDELKTVPETLLREIARQVAAGLAAIHAAGIVHRDLKPENVLITPDHVVKVMDLGVARLMEESVALTREGSFAGSLLYAAPEQFGGKPVGPPADLYSVGVMLYELASGQNPFQRDGAGAVMAAHMKDTPQRLSDRHSEVSPFFSEVVSTLLAKDPAQRLASSKAFHDLLEQGERSPWWGDREKTLVKESGHLPKIPVRRETQLHGRDETLRTLRDAWDAARAGQGRSILVEGEAGIGKTRVVDAFVATLKGEDAHVLYGAYEPSGGQGGLTGSLTLRFGAAGMEDALRPYLSATPRLIPGFAALIQHQTPPPGSEPLSADALHAVFVHLMKALAAEKPLLWIADDLQFASPDSRKVLLSLARALEGQRVLVVMTSRPGLPDEELAHFSRLANFQRTALARLGARDVIALLKDAFRSSVLAERLGGKIAFKSDGVPYFVFEMIRGLKEGNFIREQADGAYVETQVVSDIEIPSSVKDLIEARLETLSESQRAILDAGAVQGTAFDPDLVAAVVEEKKVRVLRDLAEIERRSGVVRAEGKSYRFDQNQIQEVLYRGISESLRDEYHAMLADAFAEREGVAGAGQADVPGPAAAFLVHHHLRGSRPKDALPFLDGAFGHMEKNWLHAETVETCDRALAVKGLLAGRPRCDVVFRRAQRVDLLGRRQDAIAGYSEAAALADSLGDAGARIRAKQSLGYALVQAKKLDLGESILAEVVTMARAAGDPVAEATAETTIGSTARFRGDLPDARRRFERALQLLQSAGNLAKRTGPLNGLSYVAWWSGDLATNQAVLGEAAEIARETENRGGEALILLNLAESSTDLGRFDRARDAVDAAASLSAAAGFRRTLSQALKLRVRLAVWSGEDDDVARVAAEALSLGREIGEEQAQAEVHYALGQLHADAGRTSAAREAFDAAAAASRSPGLEDCLVTAVLRAALLPGGDAAPAMDTFRASWPKLGCVTRVESAWLAFRVTGDRAHLAEAWRHLLHLRDHAPEDCRVSVMENVPLHREIAAAAKEAGL